MTRFYVYRVKSSDPNITHAIVSDPVMFAEHEFDPARMEFTGISIEAEDEMAASKIYVNPSISPDVFSCDEPTATAMRRPDYNAAMRKKVGEIQQGIAVLSAQLLAVSIAYKLAELNEKIAQLAKTVRETSENHPEVTSEKLYERLKEKYAITFRNLKYIEPRDNSKGDSDHKA